MAKANDSQLIEPGKKAPAIALKDKDGKLHRLSAYQGQWVVLYFYPKDNTSGCTKQACAFRDHLPNLGKLDAVVLGVSPDDEKSHTKFAQKHELPFTLLADPEHQALEKYGVWQAKSMYGRKFMGVVRTTYLIDPKGKVAKRWDKVKVAKHMDEVLEALNEAQG
ncbi:MAG: thioredoxin-dependent thiol peroxidase [Phycisphaeraceae bacterium]|nr:thioredoxin-dependent thiol peroxidase [Phycisphaeraceae bacterium]